MKKIIDCLMDKAKAFTAVDYLFFKIVLVTLGLILGIYFSSSLRDYLGTFWIILILSYIYLIFKMFFKK